ncbi:MAG: ribose 5-phosphate isomerase B [Acidobacteria bacterium]|nr:ribose 5-phosphate isomerase B [Acidobacteriota bacterium]
MRLAIGSDHAGLDLKHTITLLLDELKVPYEDVGTFSPASVDYPDYAEAVSRAVVEGRADRGILVCGTGIGMAIAANKIAGIRAAVVWDETSARLSRAHNDANVMTIGGRTTPIDRVPAIISAFLLTDYAGGRHDRRLDKIARLERKDS